MSSSFQLQTVRLCQCQLWEALKEKCKALILHFPAVPELFCKQQYLHQLSTALFLLLLGLLSKGIAGTELRLQRKAVKETCWNK